MSDPKTTPSNTASPSEAPAGIGRHSRRILVIAYMAVCGIIATPPIIGWDLIGCGLFILASKVYDAHRGVR